MFGLSPWEILMVMLVAVLLFGKRLPEIGSSLGKAITNFKNSSRNIGDSDNKKIDFKANDDSIECEKVDSENKN